MDNGKYRNDPDNTPPDPDGDGYHKVLDKKQEKRKILRELFPLQSVHCLQGR